MSFRLAFFAVFFSLLVGCATTSPMPLANDADVIGTDTPPLLLMTVTVKHDLKKSVELGMYSVRVEPTDSNTGPILTFQMDKKGAVQWTPESGKSAFIRMSLPPGRYTLKGVNGGGRTFPVIGTYFLPLHSDLLVKAPGVYYLGHISAVTRSRAEGEFRAGPAIPLIDQQMTAFASGTFDIEVQDQFDVDIPAFLARFPVLRTVKIQKALLAPFEREKAQKYWEAN
jgi:hypothetical protein